MSLYNFVYNLQRKNNKAKKRILVALLVVSFILLMFFWIFMFKNQLERINLSGTSSPARLLGEDQKMLSPMAALVQGFKSFKDDVTQKIGEYKLNNPSNKIENTRPVYELPQN